MADRLRRGRTPESDRGVADLYPDWPQYADRLSGAVRDLTTTQLAHRAGPGHGPIWALAAHVAGGRVFWLCGVFGVPGAETTPFTDPFGPGWEDDEARPRSGTELAWALDASWQIVADCLATWSPDDLTLTAERRTGSGVQLHTRGSVLNRLLSHDAFHAGEISQLLGVHDLPPIDLWARRPAGRP